LSVGCRARDAGTAPPAAEVSGVVTLDGKPLDAGTVTFIPEIAEEAGGRPGIARIGPNGRYQLGNANPEKPLRFYPGRYRVTVLAMQANPSNTGRSIAVLTVPERYTSPRTTPFIQEVVAGKNDVTLRLSSDLNSSAEKGK
jgi:hypothetical protein